MTIDPPNSEAQQPGDLELARDFILGRLSDREADECERRFLFEPQFEALVLSQEADLMDAYVAQRLTSEEALALDRWAEHDPRRAFRLAFAEGLHRAARAEDASRSSSIAMLDSLRSSNSRRRPRVIFGLAGLGAACLLAILFLGPARYLRHTKGVVAQPNGIASQPVLAPQPSGSTAQSNSSHAAASEGLHAEASAVATFLLLPNEQRGATGGTVITPPGTVSRIHLQLTSEEGLASGLYHANLRHAAGESVWSASHLGTRGEALHRYVLIRVAAANLSPGEYELELVPESAAGQVSLSYRFSVVPRVTK